MIPVMQTKTGGPNLPPEDRGNCLGACLASLLHIGVEEVPELHSEGWWDRMQAFLAGYGVELAAVPASAFVEDGRLAAPINGLWIASVPSVAFPDVRHAIVMRGRYVEHDPSPGRGYRRGDTITSFFEAKLLVAQTPPAPASSAREGSDARCTCPGEEPDGGFARDPDCVACGHAPASPATDRSAR